MGGANHLCNRPLIALQIARRQEAIGKRIGFTSLQIRAKCYQLVNIGLLGYKTKSMFKKLLIEANYEGFASLTKFIEASMTWLKFELNTKANAKQAICNE